VALWVAVGLAGAIGAVSRYLIDGAVQDRTGRMFPFGTLTVNVVGSLLLGVVAGVAIHHSGAATTRVVLGTGFCGGLTTWSTASWEAVRLAEEGSTKAAVTFTLVNLAASVAAGAVGLAIGLLY
jgi:CrcB protein